MSATARSLVYVAAMAHASSTSRNAVVLVEVAYVSVTAGIYAALQQRALRLPSRVLGNVLVVFAVPALAQLFDWLAHRAMGAAATGVANLWVCLFALVSAFLHLHVMRNGVFLTGHGHSLADDFRRIPRLLASFISKPFVLLANWATGAARTLESDAAP